MKIEVEQLECEIKPQFQHSIEIVGWTREELRSGTVLYRMLSRPQWSRLKILPEGAA